ncbi:MAG: 50S ribosomal protein L25/general stress protein Ctc [Alphaproteobacteria bacterium]|nr:50S ribosomal protein L25/general stress protein Ctc [Alphaproteobacteria bacterium]
MTTAKKEKSSALVATTRNGAGKGVARALRREGKLPGILYGKGQTPTSIALSAKEVTLEYQKGRFRSRLVDIALDGKTIQALPKDLQFNPVTDQIEHVDFIKVEKGVAIRVQVPVKFVGQDKSMGIKRGGVLNVVRHEIEFECTPEAIPTHIEVNVQAMDIGTSVHIADIELPKGITPTIKRNFTIAAVAGRSTADEEVKPAADAAAAPAAGAAAPAGDAKKEEPKKDEKKK